MNIENTELQNNTETAIGYIQCYSKSFLLSAVKCLEMPKYFTPKEVIEKIRIETILGNPKWS